MKKSKSKIKTVPPSANKGNVDKEVRVPDQGVNDGQPVWRFSTVDLNGPFSWPKGLDDEQAIVSKLHDFDSMRWADIEGKQHHFLSADSLSSEARKRLEAIQKDDDIESLFSFHLQGKPRIIAIRHQNIAKLLWYDPNHEVSPSEKKHT